MFYIIHSYNPDSILLQIGQIAIHWYGLLMVTAVVLGYVAVRKLWIGYGLRDKALADLFFYLIIWGFVGARAYHVLNEIGYYWQRPLRVFAVWQGGLAIHGAMLASSVVLWWYIWKYGDLFYIEEYRNSKFQIPNFKQISKSKIQKFLSVADILVVGLALGQSIGRWGNYFNQELYGRPTSLPWGIPIAFSNRVAGFESFQYFHPTFLYESAGVFLIFLLLYYLHIRRRKAEGGGWTRFLRIPGVIFVLYLFLYSILRIFVETLRIDDVPVVFGVRLPLLTSVVLITAAASIFVLLFLRKKGMKG